VGSWYSLVLISFLASLKLIIFLGPILSSSGLLLLLFVSSVVLYRWYFRPYALAHSLRYSHRTVRYIAVPRYLFRQTLAAAAVENIRFTPYLCLYSFTHTAQAFDEKLLDEELESRGEQIR